MGAAVDRALAAGNVRLTMGGEPTFVSATDFDAPEWNTDALGPTKQRLADRLMRRLRRALGAGVGAADGVGQALSGRAAAALGAVCALARGRRAGLARSRAAGRRRRRYRHRHASDAARFCAALAERLQVDPSLIQPAYEDVHYYLWREHRLPANVLAEDAKLADPHGARTAGARVRPGLGAPVGRVLPLRRAIRDDARIWQSGQWYFRGDTLFLLPGDSPIGYRLPLDSLPWADPDAIEHETEPDPFAPRAPLPPRQAFRAAPPSDTMGAGAEGFRPIAAGGAGGRPRRAGPGAHRALRRAARRHHPRVLPAALRRRGLAGARRRGRGHRRRARPQGGAGGLPAAARSAPAAFLGHARSRRDRGQRASRRRAGAKSSSAASNFTRRRARSAWPRKSSCSTAAMSAPAAATTW